MSRPRRAGVNLRVLTIRAGLRSASWLSRHARASSRGQVQAVGTVAEDVPAHDVADQPRAPLTADPGRRRHQLECRGSGKPRLIARPLGQHRDRGGILEQPEREDRRDLHGRVAVGEERGQQRERRGIADAPGRHRRVATHGAVGWPWRGGAAPVVLAGILGRGDVGQVSHLGSALGAEGGPDGEHRHGEGREARRS
jgi:hypothetical protein